MTKVKICGLTNYEDARVAVEAGADLLGFIFYESSPRYVKPEKVKEIVFGLKGLERYAEEQSANPTDNPNPVTCVGVFVNTPLETVNQILEFCRLDGAQLHGEEPPETVAFFNGRAFKALRPKSAQEAAGLLQSYFPSPPRAPAALPHVMLDAYHPHLYGGTGQVGDWALAAQIAQQYAVMLAGSLTPANVAEAVRQVNPWGVDVSSGVEVEKGRKDHEKVREFIKKVKGW
jgi:phosphoribosylanthranilate isomerase